MSVNSECQPVEKSLSEQKGEGGKDNASIINMMKEMQKNILSLTTTVSELQENKGKKRKIQESDEKPCTSKSRVELSDVSDEERDEFDDILNETNEDMDTDCDHLLDELAECFGSEDKCGEAIHEKLAKVTNDGVRTVVDSDKIKEVSDKYNRPKNVQNLVTPKLNEEIRAHLSRKVRGQDIRIQRTQTLVGKAIVPQLQQINLLLNAKQKGETPSTKELTTLAMDSLKLMTYVYCDLSNRRRELIIQPEKNEEFRALCSNEYPVTDKLFGDDLGKKVEDILKANKVGSKISGFNKFDKRGNYNRKQHGHMQKSSNYGNYKASNFLGQRWGSNYKKRTAPANKQRKQ
ncbi:uncharacterized protein LOC134243769 [Saccostrea cucullata]|uniref:uncharacterized protein LOC134243769 n=1 Tax=Saccostrea cuccullata TaxID=36930 RepID=UPI002ED16D87